VSAIKTGAPARIHLAPLATDGSAAVLAVDSDGRVLAANRSACAILGWGRVELLTLDMSDVGVSAPVLARLYDEVNDHDLGFGEAALRHRDGRSIPVHYQMTRVELADGSLYLLVAHPRTDRRSISRVAGRRAEARALRMTDRELEIVQLIADGLGNREIAQTLQISLETVKTYVRRLLGKLGARSRAHAVAIAWHKELVD
jgi:PAS domain S-box-containing protein